MNKKSVVFKRSLVLSVLLIIPCVGAAPTVATDTVSPAKVMWQQEWNKIVAAAKKEGKVSVYSIWPPAVRINLTQAFRKKYGINMEFSPFSRGNELVAKVQAEKRAGLSIADLYGAGATTLVATMKPMGLLGPMEALLVLPEVKDSKYWKPGKLPFIDKDKFVIAMNSSVLRYVIYNVNLLKKGEITSYKDVLKPQYQGKITLSDPTVIGTGNSKYLMEHGTKR